MEKTKNFVKKWLFQITTIIFALLFLNKGCTNKKITKINKRLDSDKIEITRKIDSLENAIIKMNEKTFSKKEMVNEMEKVMLDFLIYEDDLDKGKTSLTDIKNKIKVNE